MHINVPGSKSHSNRALILNALAQIPAQITNFVDCEDTKYMLKGLAEIKKEKEPKIFTGNAGTTTRFLTAFATTQNKKIIISGSERMHKRPIQPLTESLNTLGAKIDTTTSCPPVTIHPQKIKGGKVKLPGDISSQYISALLMVAPTAEKTITIEITTPLCSIPYVEMTLKLLKQFGVKVQNENYRKFIVEPQTIIAPSQVKIETDASSSSYFGAYAALHPNKPITISNLLKDSIQGDIQFITYLEQMGCQITEDGSELTIQGPQQLKSLGTIDMNKTPDLVMTFAVLAMFTEGLTKITNIANLRIKETDRIQALQNELSKFPVKTTTTEDSISITGNPQKLEKLKESPEPIIINTYDDHRMAMCFGPILDFFPQIEIEDPKCVTKSYPSFWQHLRQVTANFNITLTGLRGSGKSKLAKILAEKINWPLIDIDHEIEKTEQQSIPEIIKEKGWEYFRARESQITQNLADIKQTIISTGGGTILDNQNTKALKKNGRIIYLYVKPKVCAQRILNSKNRPSLTNQESVEEEIKQLYKERNGLYCESADIILSRTNSPIEDAEEIINKVFST
jgi:3-phosphoshikimate 1-carboxyvinyltransferase